MTNSEEPAEATAKHVEEIFSSLRRRLLNVLHSRFAMPNLIEQVVDVETAEEKRWRKNRDALFLRSNNFKEG